jgi:RimJ/RimL family protein N-acetyltransferase
LSGSGAVELAGGGVLLRPWREHDRAALVRHANDRRIWRNLTDRFPHPYTDEAAVEWLARNRAEEGPPHNLAIVVDGEACGGAGLEPRSDLARRTAEVGYWLGVAFWGRGLATAALRLLTAYAFERFDFARLEASVLAWNPASGRVLEKAGYAREARLRQAAFKDGELVDTFLYARLRGDR